MSNFRIPTFNASALSDISCNKAGENSISCGYELIWKSAAAARMDPCLTQPIPIAMPVWKRCSGTPRLSGYSNITSVTPIIGKFLGSVPPSEGYLAADNLFARTLEFNGPGECKLETVSKEVKDAFCKVTHLLDPIRTIQTYYSSPEKGDRRREVKAGNPMNQAYVDGLASYLLGQLRERNISPHFCLFYGGYRGLADKYRYNISGEYESYRRYKLFWERRRQGLFSVHYDDDKSQIETPNSSMRSTNFHYSTPRSGASHISLDYGGEVIPDIVELESVGTLESATSSSVSESESESDSGSEDYSEESTEGSAVFMELKEFPVMLIFQEKMEGVLDSMLDDQGEIVGVPRNTEAWEQRWIAWTFQIVAALSAAQGALGFTHNDLHTNNIVWKSTDQQWLHYISRDGTVWKVPTFGKIMCLIDFGRAIYRVKEEWFVSDDYEKGGDAEGQYVFGHLLKGSDRPIYPNPSFDLCRYAVSVIDALYPEKPTENPDGAILSQEGLWKVNETVSPFWNLLWSWLIDDNGNNVLREEYGEERFPDFDLYQHISEKVTNCKPQDQIRKEIFTGFQIARDSLGAEVKLYPLFC
jgi:hypothetical protein